MEQIKVEEFCISLKQRKPINFFLFQTFSEELFLFATLPV